MLKIYGADLSTPANKVRMTANFLNMDYEYIRVKVREGEQNSAWFKAINPVGKIPAIDDDGFTLFESGAICRYLAEKTGGGEFYPRDLKARARVDAWSEFVSHHVQQAMSKIIFNTVFYKLAKQERDERSLADGKSFLNRFLPVVENRLAASPHLASDKLTLADVTLINALDPAETCATDLSVYPQIVRWRKAIKETPWYKKCHEEYGLPLKQFLAQGA